VAGLSGAVRTPGQPSLARAGSLELVRATGLTGVVRRASDHATGEVGTERILPVSPELRGLLPGGGLRRGATVAVTTAPVTPVTGSGPAVGAGRGALPIWSAGATSLLLTLLTAASQAGSWCTVVGVPTLSATAAAEAGIALDRLALVPNPGPDWASVVGALLDGLDIVVVAVPGPVAPSVSGRLAARARQRGSVLVSHGEWCGADVTLDVTTGRWHGLGDGRGRLQCRELTIVARGRGAAAAPRRAHVWLPRPTGLYAQLHPQLQLTPEQPRLAVVSDRVLVERAG
jgi:hypothetical protein